MKKYAIVKEGQKPTKKQLKERESLKNAEVRPNEENPELSFEEMERLRLAALDRRNNDVGVYQIRRHT